MYIHDYTEGKWLDQWLSTAQQKVTGSFKNSCCLGFNPRGCDLIGWLWGPMFAILKERPRQFERAGGVRSHCSRSGVLKPECVSEHLTDLLTHEFVGPTPRVSDPGGLGCSLRISTSNCFPNEVDDIGWGTISPEPLIHTFKSPSATITLTGVILRKHEPLNHWVHKWIENEDTQASILDKVFRLCFEVSRYRGRESGPAKLLPQKLHSASQHQATRALNCVCEHLGFTTTYSVHPLARCVPRYQKA